MTASFQAYLDLGRAEPEDPPTLLALSQFALQETYNAGWRGEVVAAVRADEAITIGQTMGVLMKTGVVPGVAAVLRLGYVVDEEQGLVNWVRSWPVVVEGMDPRQSSVATSGHCLIAVVDPLTHLARRPVWGAFRGVSAAEMLGGVISLAAGTLGRATLEPHLPELPRLSIQPSLREALSFIPYAIATGQSLADWLMEFLGHLGVRMEMIGRHDGSILLKLLDSVPSGDPISMSLGEPEGDEAEGGRVIIEEIIGRPGRTARGVVLDDPTQVGFRRIRYGAVGRVMSGVEVGLDEAARRAETAIHGAYTEMLIVKIASGQPGFRPGRLVDFDFTVREIAGWQLASVTHRFSGTTYHNQATLLDSITSWHPAPPPARPPVIVPGVVDGGSDYAYLEPVPRDHMGRIPVYFPFSPGRTLFESAIAEFDTDGDHRVTLDDFDGPVVFEEAPGLTPDEQAALAYDNLRRGEYDDPYPGVADEDLTEEELAERKATAERRRHALHFLAYRRAVVMDEADRDRDGYITSRDDLVSDDAAYIYRAEEARQNSPFRSTTIPDPNGNDGEEGEGDGEEGEEGEGDETTVGDGLGGLVQTHPGLSEEDHELLFGDAGQQERRVAAAAPERWPPRLPLTVVQPMAGGLHGFIASHRQGDACRVAVHDPFWAEVIGFQYREDRPINTGIATATAGIVVEHDSHEAWSGVVFQRSEDVEGEDGGDNGNDGDDGNDDDSSGDDGD